MYAVYGWQAGATLANVMADIVAVLTGTTDKTLLSADCAQAATSINASVYPAGWTAFDTNTGANTKVLRSPLPDDPTKYMYLILDWATANKVRSRTAESWDNVTHVATNPVSGHSSTSGASMNLTVAGTVVLFSQSTGLAIFGSVGGGASFVTARTRDSVWDTVAAGWPPVVTWGHADGDTSPVAGGTFNGINCPRIYGVSADGAQRGHFRLGAAILNSYLSAITTSITDPSTGQVGTAFLPLGVLGDNIYTPTWMGGWISGLFDIWATRQSYGSTFDEVDDSLGNRYVVLASGGARLAVRKG